ncbi:MAG: substrate-binding domain-containing protein [Anaerolineales bacterium]
MARPKERLTYGFLTANVHTGASRVLWPGLLDAAEDADINLITYPGGRLAVTDGFEDQRNFLYGLVNKNQLDGLVSWTSTLAGSLSSEEIVEFHEAYRPLPLVSLAFPLGENAFISIDGYQGMRALISHLVDVHSFTKLMLIRGPKGHPYAEERHRAYQDALKEKGLKLQKNLVSPHVNWENGEEAIRVLLDERKLRPGKDFQAIVAASDLLAIGVLGVLSARGISIPGDVAVVGFNDIEEGRLVRPALTSVSLPFYEQGYRSIEALSQALAGKPLEEPLVLGSELLVRQSCGCPSRSVDLAVAKPASLGTRDLRAALGHARFELVAQIEKVIRDRRLAATWAKQLLDALHRELTDVGLPGQFRSTLDSLLQKGLLGGERTPAWQGAISLIRREILPALEEADALRAEALFGQARVVVAEAIERALIARLVQAERQSEALRHLGQELSTTFDVSKLCDVLVEQLPNLEINSCYLALEEPPSGGVDRARLVLAYRDGERLDVGASEADTPANELLRAEFLPNRRFSLVVEPLYFQTQRIGYVAFEVGPRDGTIFEVLRAHISSALKGALLFREAQDARLSAEKADQIKTRLLANVSHELRTPLNIIIGHAQHLSLSLADGRKKDVEHIRQSAEHQLRIINDLLDISRAEINALDLYPEVLDPKLLIQEAFSSLAKDVADSKPIEWKLDLPAQLNSIEADPVRLRQILLNLLGNAAKFTKRGRITMGAAPEPPNLHIWVKDTGLGIPADVIDHIFDPFFSHGEGAEGGIGLGLSITRHLVALHHGSLSVESQPAKGSTFNLYLPLQKQSFQQSLAQDRGAPTLWLFSRVASIPDEVLQFSQKQGLEVLAVKVTDDLEDLISRRPPKAIAWNIADAGAKDWEIIHRLHNHPRLKNLSVLLFEANKGTPAAAGLTTLVLKSANEQSLWEGLSPALPDQTKGSVLIIDDEAGARRQAYEAVKKGMPHWSIRTAEDGATGLMAMLAERPNLVVLDLMMPGMDGFEVLERMRSDEHTKKVPVVILSNRQLTLTDVKRLERYEAVSLQSKGVFSEEEIADKVMRASRGDEALHSQTSALAKRAIAYLHQNYARQLSRREIAEGIGVSEDYLSRLFKREFRISPWEYLNRYRVFRAKALLSASHATVGETARKVGYSDLAYFSRVFHKFTGLSPSAYRDGLGG